MDDRGAHWPTPEAMRQPLLAVIPATACHLDGYAPLGTDHWVMVMKDAHDRILITHLWKTIILISFPNALTSTGIKPCGICGKRGWGSTGVGPTLSRGGGCSEGLRKTMMG
jgi:hypothetical protein